MSFVTHPSQFAPPTPRKVERIDEIPGLNSADDTPAKLFARKLRRSEYTTYERSLMDENGVRTLETWIDNKLKYIAATICGDKQGNLLWQDPKDAIVFLNQYDSDVSEALFVAALKVNAPDPKAVDRAEKNSEGTPSGSENGTSASTSESLIPVS